MFSSRAASSLDRDGALEAPAPELLWLPLLVLVVALLLAVVVAVVVAAVGTADDLDATAAVAAVAVAVAVAAEVAVAVAAVAVGAAVSDCKRAVMTRRRAAYSRPGSVHKESTKASKRIRRVARVGGPSQTMLVGV